MPSRGVERGTLVEQNPDFVPTVPSTCLEDDHPYGVYEKEVLDGEDRIINGFHRKLILNRMNFLQNIFFL